MDKISNDSITRVSELVQKVKVRMEYRFKFFLNKLCMIYTYFIEKAVINFFFLKESKSQFFLTHSHVKYTLVLICTQENF